MEKRLSSSQVQGGKRTTRINVRLVTVTIEETTTRCFAEKTESGPYHTLYWYTVLDQEASSKTFMAYTRARSYCSSMLSMQGAQEGIRDILIVKSWFRSCNFLRHPSTDTRASPLLQVPVPDEEREEAGKSRSRYDDDERQVEGGDVRIDDGFLELLWKPEDVGHGLADTLERLRGDHADILGQIGVELGAEYGSCDGNADGTTDELQEGDKRGSLRDRLWLVCVLGLDGNDCVLEGDTSTETEEDLKANQLCVACVDVNGVKETTGGCGENGAKEEERPITSGLVDNGA
jgi:hypothetical protein